MAKEKIIQFEGSKELIWKHPATIVDCNTRIYVPATHVCVYMKDGLMLDTLMPGKHQVVEKKGLFAKRENFMSSFIYINVEQVLNLNWGTRNSIEVFDPLLSIPCEISANGRYQISIKNPREFILKVGGLESTFSTSDFEEYMLAIVTSNIKEAISRAMTIEKISFYDIWSNMSNLSNRIYEFLLHKFDDYGVKLYDFSVIDIFMPEDIKNLVKKVHMEKYGLNQRGFTHKELYEDERKDNQSIRSTIKDIVVSSKKDEKKETITCPKCSTENELGSYF